MHHIYSKQRGFTVPEIIVVLTIASLLLIGVVSLMIALTNSSADTIKISDQIKNNHGAISSIERDLQLTKSFLATNDTTKLADSNQSVSPAGSTSGWVIGGAGADSRILILQTYATTQAPQNQARTIVYYDDGIGGCPVGRDPVYNNIIYYLGSDNNLYRRTLVEATPSAPYCSGQTIAQVRTCGVSPCTQKDVVVATNISRFSVQYYETPTDSTPNTSIYTGTVAEAAPLLANSTSIRVDIRSAGIGEGQGGISSLDSYRRLTKGVQHE